MADDNFPTLSRNPSTVSRKLNPIGAVEANFGGSSQRGYISLRPVKESFTLNYSYIDQDDFDDLYDFIKQRLSVEAFNWTHPISDVTYEMVCTSFDDGVESGNVRYNVSLSIKEI